MSVTKEQLTEARKRAEKGARILDRKAKKVFGFPVWTKTVILTRLDMHDSRSCVLGQLESARIRQAGEGLRWAPFDRGAARLLGRDDSSVSFQEAVRYGFERDSDVPYAALDRAWRDVIRERRAALKAKGT